MGDHPRLGRDPGAVGRLWQAPGMSYVVFDGDRVRLEVDYHDAGSRARSLQVPER